MTTSLPPIDTAALPPDVQKAGPQARQLYGAALDFERVLLEQLTSELDQSSQAGDGSSDDGSGGDGTTALYNQMLPGALAQGITGAGGIGLADDLYRSLSGSSK